MPARHSIRSVLVVLSFAASLGLALATAAATDQEPARQPCSGGKGAGDKVAGDKGAEGI